MHLTLKMLGFDMIGDFVNVYTNYNLEPHFPKKYFDRIVMKYDTAFNKKTAEFWEENRPVALESDEQRDFQYRDSIAKLERDSMFTRLTLDSLRKRRKPISVKDIVWGGVNHQFFGKKGIFNYNIKPLLTRLQYNTVEGVSLGVEQSLTLRPARSNMEYILGLDSRYGFSNTHFNSFATLTMQRRTSNLIKTNYLRFSGGKRLSQFNHDNPIDEFTNSIFTLFWRKNFMKVYENWFGAAEFSTKTER